MEYLKYSSIGSWLIATFEKENLDADTLRRSDYFMILPISAKIFITKTFNV